MHYQKLKAGWDKAAAADANSAIHPAGAHGTTAYVQSGEVDVVKLLTDINRYHVHSAGRLHHSSIIDYGCGNGRMSVILADYFARVYAVDISYAMLQALPKRENIIPVLVNDNVFLLPDEPADLVVSVSVFIHNTYADGKQILKQISENLKPGGQAFLQIPLYEEPKEPTTWTDVGVWTLEQLYLAASEAELVVIDHWTNPGRFSYSSIGDNHAAFQILQK